MLRFGPRRFTRAALRAPRCKPVLRMADAGPIPRPPPPIAMMPRIAPLPPRGRRNSHGHIRVVAPTVDAQLVQHQERQRGRMPDQPDDAG